MAGAFVHDFLQIRPVIVDNAFSEIFMAAMLHDADDIAFLKIAYDCHDAFGKQALCLNSKCFRGTLVDVEIARTRRLQAGGIPVGG